MTETSHNKHPSVVESSAGASAAMAADSSRDKARSAANPFDILLVSVLVCFAVVLTLVIACQNWTTVSPWSVALFLIIALASELLPVTMPDGNAEVTLTPIVVWGVVALFGPAYGTLVAFFAVFLGSLIYKQVIHHPDAPIAGFWRYLVYNSCLIGTNAGVGALCYNKLCGVQLAAVDMAVYPISHVILPLMAATFVALALELFFYALGSAITQSEQENDVSFNTIYMRAKVLLFRSVFSFLPSYIMFTPFAFVLAYLYVWRGLGFWGILPILIPFFSVRQTLKLLMANTKAYRETITTLAMLMQKYHPYTRGHLKRVADLSLRLARELRLPASSQQWIWEAGLLHDIGKVGVSEQILDKPGKLTDNEWVVIKDHPVKSADIIAQLEFLERIVPWVRHHHERVDGSGYPDGLRENELPLEAAIIAVADAFDAMTGTRVPSRNERTHCDACLWAPDPGLSMPDECPECGATLTRSYREPMSVEDAIQQLRYGVGTQFSPRVVRGFIRMMAREGIHLDD